MPGSPRSRRDLTVLAILGLLAGLASALFGVGGGLVIVPILVAFRAYPIKVAVGTSLFAIAAVSAVGTSAEALVAPANIRPVLAAALVAGSLLGAGFGAEWARRLPDACLRAGLVLFMLLSAAKLIFGSTEGAAEGLLSFAEAPVQVLAIEAVVGLLAGAAASLFGIGGGIVVVPATTFLVADVTFHAARATSLLVIVPTSLVGAWRHGRFGHVDAGTARALAPTGALGAIAGVLVANETGAALLRTLFGFFLVAAAARLAFSSRKGRNEARAGAEKNN